MGRLRNFFITHQKSYKNRGKLIFFLNYKRFHLQMIVSIDKIQNYPYFLQFIRNEKVGSPHLNEIYAQLLLEHIIEDQYVNENEILGFSSILNICCKDFDHKIPTMKIALEKDGVKYRNLDTNENYCGVIPSRIIDLTRCCQSMFYSTVNTIRLNTEIYILYDLEIYVKYPHVNEFIANQIYPEISHPAIINCYTENLMLQIMDETELNIYILDEIIFDVFKESSIKLGHKLKKALNKEGIN